MNLSDAVLNAFARGDHGKAGEVVATPDPILSKPVAPLLTPGMLAALGADLPPSVEERLTALEERLAKLEQPEP